MDSRPATYEHIAEVQRLVLAIATELIERARDHDRSKLSSPELELFDEYTEKLATTTYGSDEYRGYLEAMGPALGHHYRVNAHHPEHFENGIHDMTLVDLIEMLCDWAAATLRHEDGDLDRSITQNRERFGYGPELERVLRNTARELRIAGLTG